MAARYLERGRRGCWVLYFLSLYFYIIFKYFNMFVVIFNFDFKLLITQITKMTMLDQQLNGFIEEIDRLG